MCSVLNYLYLVSSCLYSVWSYLYSVTSYIYSVSSYFLDSVSHAVQQDIVPHILPCSKFRNNQIEIRNRQIQEYQNTKNRILWKKEKHGKRWKNYILYNFIYFIGGTSNFILMILLINQWYLESRKPHIIQV